MSMLDSVLKSLGQSDPQGMAEAKGVTTSLMGGISNWRKRLEDEEALFGEKKSPSPKHAKITKRVAHKKLNRQLFTNSQEEEMSDTEQKPQVNQKKLSIAGINFGAEIV